MSFYWTRPRMIQSHRSTLGLFLLASSIVDSVSAPRSVAWFYVCVYCIFCKLVYYHQAILTTVLFLYTGIIASNFANSFTIKLPSKAYYQYDVEFIPHRRTVTDESNSFSIYKSSRHWYSSFSLPNSILTLDEILGGYPTVKHGKSVLGGVGARCALTRL